MTALSELGKLMNPPALPLEADVEWGAVEAALSATLPQDYKDFIGMYGSGSINGFLTILNPAASDDHRNLFKQLEVSRADADRVSEYFSTLVAGGPPLLYGLYPERGGFLPWGRAGNGRWCDWMTSDDPPDTWFAAVRVENGYTSYNAPFAEFLVGLLTDCFPAFAQEMYPWPEPEFVPAGSEPRRF